LGAVLHDDVVPPRQLDGVAALVDVVAARLLDVDVLVGLARPDRHERVPVVGRGDRDGVEVPVFQGGAHVLDGARHVAAACLHGLGPGGEGARVGVDQIYHPDVLHAGEGVDVGAAAAVQAGDADAQRLVGADDLGGGLGAGKGNGGAGGEDAFHKIAAGQSGH